MHSFEDPFFELLNTPSPEALKEYDSVVPGAGEKIVEQWARDLRTRREMGLATVYATHWAERQFVAATALLAVVTLVSSLWLIKHGSLYATLLLTIWQLFATFAILLLHSGVQQRVDGAEHGRIDYIAGLLRERLLDNPDADNTARMIYRVAMEDLRIRRLSVQDMSLRQEFALTGFLGVSAYVVLALIIAVFFFFRGSLYGTLLIGGGPIFAASAVLYLNYQVRPLASDPGLAAHPDHQEAGGAEGRNSDRVGNARGDVR